MSKIVWIFGLISGAILSVMMAITMLFIDAIGFDRSELIGYTSMVVAFLLIFFGIRAYRDNVAGGSVSFGRAFSVGALILVVASLTWRSSRSCTRTRQSTRRSPSSSRCRSA